MNMKKILYLLMIVSGASLILYALISLTPKQSTFKEGAVIAVRISHTDTTIPGENFSGLTSGEISQLILLEPNDPSGTYNVITERFYSAISPVVSLDRTSILFSARKSVDSSWQIYKMGANLKEVAEISGTGNDCFDPFFLPDGNAGFSCAWEADLFGRGSALFVHDFRSSETRPVTFHPHMDHSASLLHDGRILYTTKRIYPDKSSAVLNAIRPDGSGNMTFLHPGEYGSIWGKAQESNERELFYLAGTTRGTGVNFLLSVPYENPHRSPNIVYRTNEGHIHSFSLMNEDSFIISYRETVSETLDLFKLSGDEKELQPLLSSERYHYITPVVAGAVSVIPKKLPSSLRHTMSYGIAVIVDPEHSFHYLTQQKEASFLVSITSPGEADSMITPAADGSLYLKLDAGNPVQISRTNSDGVRIGEAEEWLWVMPGERTGFTGWNGCRLISPANRVPLAINEPAVDLTGSGTSLFLTNTGLNVYGRMSYENQ